MAGDGRSFHHGVQAAGKNIMGCGILDTDLVAAFDWLCMDWVQLVLLKKAREAVTRITNLYYNNITIIVVNNKLGRSIENRRHSLGQGDKTSMEWICFAIDPVIDLLDMILTGIPILSLPVFDPSLPPPASLPAPIIQKYTVL